MPDSLPSPALPTQLDVPPGRARSIIVSSNFPPMVGGTCRVYAALAEEGAGLVHVLAPRRSFLNGERLDGSAAFDRNAGYPVHRLDLLRPLAERTGWRTIPADLWIMGRLMAVLAWLCLRYRIGTICIGDLIYGGWLAWPMRHLMRRRVLMCVYGEEMTESAGGLFERWKGAFLRQADGVLAVSGFARDVAVARFGVPPGRVRIVLNGVDLATFRPRMRAEDLAGRFGVTGGPVLLTVARLIERKGVDTVLRALPAVAKAVPGVRYVVAGDGPDRPRLEALAAELGLAGRVIFTGRLSADELPRIYSLGDVFAMPNRRLASGDNEGFGLVFLEANACGLPVIAGIAGGTGDAVEDGETGLLVDGTNPGRVAEAAIALLGEPTRRRAMGANGLRFAGERGWSQRFRRYQDAVMALPAMDAPETAVMPQPHHVQRPPSGPEVVLPERPMLLVVVDAEEQFDWQTFLADAVDVSNMRHLGATSAIYARHGLRPTYMVDYPVVSHADGIEPLRELLAAGACTVGAQLHPWVNPPLLRRVSTVEQSYPGNLPAAEERAKLIALTEAIERTLGVRPRCYRSGRYGMGPNTTAILRELGYRIDCSVLPCNDLSTRGGPDFSAWTARPGWLDAEAGLLEVPITLGMLGPLGRAGWAPGLLASDRLGRARVPGMLARAGLLERIKLTPEGTTVAEAKRLTRGLMAQGQRLFVITYHTTSLVPGHAPYVRTEADLRQFHGWIDEFCGWFLGEMGGRAGTLDEVYHHAVRRSGAMGREAGLISGAPDCKDQT